MIGDKQPQGEIFVVHIAGWGYLRKGSYPVYVALTSPHLSEAIQYYRVGDARATATRLNKHGGVARDRISIYSVALYVTEEV